VNGSEKSTGMVIIPILCTIVTLRPVVLTSETRKEKKQHEKETYKNVNCGGGGLVQHIFLTKRLSITVTHAIVILIYKYFDGLGMTAICLNTST